MNPNVNSLFAIGIDILKTTRDDITNTILAQTGSVTEEYPSGDNAEYWQHVGFVSRPAPPTAKSAAAQGIAIRCSDRDRVVATRDVRGQSIYGNLDDGETCLYAPVGMAALMLRKDGSVTMATTSDNAQTATSNLIKRSMSPDPMQGIVDFSPWGSSKINATGWHVLLPAGRMDAGGMSAPGVPSALGSYWTFQTGTFSAQASVVNLGPTREAQLPIALATPLLAYLALMQTFVTTAAALIDGLAATVATPGVAPGVALATQVAAMNAAAAAVGVPPIVIASTSTNSN